MLVLTRKLNESIIINGNIVVKVASIKGNQVRLAIEAPPEVSIHRSEIAESIASFREPQPQLVMPASSDRLSGSLRTRRSVFPRKTR